MTRFQSVKARAKRLGLELWNDSAAECYRISAPDGFRIDDADELHEYVGAYGWGGAGSRSEALADLLDRLSHVDGVVKCSGHCDWCGDRNYPPPKVHTLGPWEVVDVRCSGNHVYWSIRAWKSTIGFAGVYGGPNHEADARLIAAAPDLLQAAQAIVRSAKWWEQEAAQEGWVAIEIPISDIATLREATAKAIGKAEGPAK